MLRHWSQLVPNMPANIRGQHTVYPRSEVFSRSFPLQRGPAGAGRSKTSNQVNTSIYVKCSYCTSNRSSWLERKSFSVSCGVNVLTFGFLYTSQSTFSFLISVVCRQNCTFFKNDRTMQSLGALWFLSLCY